MIKKETLKLLEGKEKNFKNLLSISLGKIYNNQNRFIDYIGDYSKWNVDLIECTLKLDDKAYDVEFIGTTSTSDNFWFSSELENVIPDKGVQMMISARKNLEQNNFTQLAQGKIELTSDIDGYKLSMIYMAFANEDSMYFCGAGDTLIYMFVKNLPQELFKPINSVEFSNRVIEIISQFDVDHKLLVKTILIENGIEFEEKENNIIAKFKEDILIEYNTNNQITKISGNLSL